MEAGSAGPPSALLAKLQDAASTHILRSRAREMESSLRHRKQFRRGRRHRGRLHTGPQKACLSERTPLAFQVQAVSAYTGGKTLPLLLFFFLQNKNLLLFFIERIGVTLAGTHLLLCMPHVAISRHLPSPYQAPGFNALRETRSLALLGDGETAHESGFIIFTHHFTRDLLPPTGDSTKSPL